MAVFLFASFATAFVATVQITTTSHSLVLSSSNRITKNLLKAMRRKKKHNKVVVIARCKLNSTEKRIYKVHIDNEISQEELTTIIN